MDRSDVLGRIVVPLFSELIQVGRQSDVELFVLAGIEIEVPKIGSSLIDYISF